MDVCIDLNCLLHVPSAVKLGKALEPYNLLFYEDPIHQREGAENLRVRDGYLELPQKPGFGIDIVEKEAAKHPYSLHERCNWVSDFRVV